MTEFKTETHTEELDFIFEQNINSFDSEMSRSSAIIRDFKAYCRLVKRKAASLMQKKLPKYFTNILYLTLDCPPYTPNSARLDSPMEFISKMRMQYPENDIRIIIPILNLTPEDISLPKLSVEIKDKIYVLEQTPVKFEFFLQNRLNKAVVYKFPKNRENIQVYGICSPAFSFCRDVNEIARLQYLAPFLKSVRIASKKLVADNFKPDIIHSENIPFYLGGEFDKDFLGSKIKVLQGIKDFIQIDIAKSEAFWAAINLADKFAMARICKDKVIKKCIASLFNLHNAKRFYQMKDCLRFIYKNYYKFRKYVDKGEDIEENVIFNRLNARVLQLFPQMSYNEDLYFNPYMYTLKRADFWTTVSETYYNEIFENPLLSGKMYQQIQKTKEKSDFVKPGLNTDKFGFASPREVYQSFNSENFRELRNRNKTAILKEFSEARIKTNFVDPTLFASEDFKIIGSLDTFYDAPLLFAHTNTEIYANGVDVLFNTILKLFELHKSIQVIMCIKDGLKVNFIKTWIDFLEKNTFLKGKWVFIDGAINPSKFYAASDMTLIPRRANLQSPEHLLAIHYGSVPVVSRSGILNDDIKDIFDNISNGCGLKTKTGLLTEEDNNELYLAPVMKALNIYQHNPSSWNLLIKNCLSTECGWRFEDLEKYNEIYKRLV